MARKAFTFRIDPDDQAALARLSKILRRPMNKLIGEAVAVYLAQRSREVERDLEADLERLRAYRRRDPDFEQAIEAFIDAEVSVDDPLEGRPTAASGPVRTRIRRLLTA